MLLPSSSVLHLQLRLRQPLSLCPRQRRPRPRRCRRSWRKRQRQRWRSWRIRHGQLGRRPVVVWSQFGRCLPLDVLARLLRLARRCRWNGRRSRRRPLDALSNLAKRARIGPFVTVSPSFLHQLTITRSRTLEYRCSAAIQYISHRLLTPVVADLCEFGASLSFRLRLLPAFPLVASRLRMRATRATGRADFPLATPVPFRTRRSSTVALERPSSLRERCEDAYPSFCSSAQFLSPPIHCLASSPRSTNNSHDALRDLRNSPPPCTLRNRCVLSLSFRRVRPSKRRA